MNHLDLAIQIMIHHYKLMIQAIQDTLVGLLAMSPNPNSAAGSIRSQPCLPYPLFSQFVHLSRYLACCVESQLCNGTEWLNRLPETTLLIDLFLSLLNIKVIIRRIL